MANEDKDLEDFAGKIEQQFPNVTPKEVSLYIQFIGGVGQKLIENKVEGDPLVKFLEAVGKASMESKDYQKLLQHLKMTLVAINRTTGLTNAYLIGVALGYFLAKPEALPEDSFPMEEGIGGVQ